jgi:hypothetical protein
MVISISETFYGALQRFIRLSRKGRTSAEATLTLSPHFSVDLPAILWSADDEKERLLL